MTTSSPTSAARRSKICHIIHLDGPGGGPLSVITHLNYFACNHAGEFEMSAIYGGHGQIAETCEKLGITHFSVPIGRKSQLPLGFFKLVGAIRRINPDLVILNGQWAGPVGALASRLAGCCKIVYIARWPAFYSSRDLYRAIRSHLVELIPARLARRTVALSAGNHYQYLIRRLVPESRLRVICNPIDLNRVPHPDDIEALRRENDWNPDACHVVSVGRIVDQKHIDWLLRSWKLVASRAPTARLSIVGSGPMQPRLEELAAELGLGDSVFFLGERPEGIRYIAAADAIVMTTLYEGHANVPLEAMACGKPIVANEVDGVSGSLDDGVEGFLIVPGDIRTFAARLLRMIRSKALRARMGAEGRKRVTQFVLPKIMKQYYALIKEVLCEDGLSPGHDDSRSNQSPRGGFPRAVVGPGSGCAGGGKS